jgi:hypothetical protein
LRKLSRNIENQTKTFWQQRRFCNRKQAYRIHLKLCGSVTLSYGNVRGAQALHSFSVTYTLGAQDLHLRSRLFWLIDRLSSHQRLHLRHPNLAAMFSRAAGTALRRSLPTCRQSPDQSVRARASR